MKLSDIVMSWLGANPALKASYSCASWVAKRSTFSESMHAFCFFCQTFPGHLVWGERVFGFHWSLLSSRRMCPRALAVCWQCIGGEASCVCTVFGSMEQVRRYVWQTSIPTAQVHMYFLQVGTTHPCRIRVELHLLRKHRACARV